MTKTNLASIAHALGFLADRTVTDAVADELRGHLETATGLIAAHLNTQFTSTTQVKVFDIAPGFTDTPGVLATPFTQPYRPRFKLPVTGNINGLVVKYRGGHPLEAGFVWDGIDPLVEFQDYVLRQETGEIQLLFRPEGMPQGLRVEYTEGYATAPDVLSGTRATNHLMQLGVDTGLAPLPAMFTGVPHPRVTDCATVAGTAALLASLTVVPPEPIAAHRVRIYAPQDQALAKSGQGITLTLHGGPEGEATQLATVNVGSPMPGHVYELAGDPATAYGRYEVRITGGADDEVAVGSVRLDFVDTDTLTMEGSAPEGLSTACAMLAAHLYRKAARDGVGKTADVTGRSYVGGVIPADVLQLLRPFRRSRISFV